MATDPVRIKKFLAYEETTTDWKSLALSALHARIEEATGRRFRRTKGPPLYDHQFRALAMSLDLQRALLFMGMRSGKTRVALEFCEHLRKARMWRGKGLIIVPSPTVISVWKDQIAEYTNLQPYFLTKINEEMMLESIEQDHDITVVPWSVIQGLFSIKQPLTKYRKIQYDPQGNPIMKLQVDRETALLYGDYYSLTIIDEIHMAKNIEGLRFKAAVYLSENSDYRLGLTGTPFGRYPVDVWSQANLVDEGRTLSNSFYFFREAFTTRIPKPWFGKYAADIQFDMKKLPILAKKLASISIAYELHEVRTYTETSQLISLKQETEQANHYKQIVADAYKQSEEFDVKPKNVFSKLRQLSSGHISFIGDEGDVKKLTLPSHAKLTWLRNTIDSSLAATPFVFYYEFDASGDQLMAELKRAKIKVGRVWGKGTDNSKEIKQFQQGKLQGLVINSKSGAMGIDLWPADYMCFYEPMTSPILRAQAEKRPYGPKRGTRLVHIEDLVVSTTERNIYGYLKEGAELLHKTIHKPKDLWKFL